MVYFKEILSSGHKYLAISKDEGAEDEVVLKLVVHPTKVGIYAPHMKLDVQWDDLRQWSKKISDDPSRSKPDIQRDDLRQGSKKISAAHSRQDLWMLESPTYLFPAVPKPSPSLGHGIISGTSQWGGSLRFRGEFAYIPKYWEWLEYVISRNRDILIKSRIFDAIYCSRYTYDHNPDIMRAFLEAWCPDLNVLETSSGAVSISLWDLQKLGGLSIRGDLYEETIPCLEELTGSQSCGRFLPRNCEYLLAAFYHLQDGKKQVRVSSWINFWFKGSRRYNKPPKRVSRKSSRPKNTHNPSLPIAASKPWGSEEQVVFEELGIKNQARPLTYLSAFIACWLCTFVFPQTDGFIHPGTFKAASLMSTGKYFNLAVPVLTSLYRGLNEVCRSGVVGRSCFPAHYIYGWLGHYFKTHYAVPNKVEGPLMTRYSGEGGAIYYDEHAARRHIHDGDNIYLRANLYCRDGDLLITDDPKSKDCDISFLISIRPYQLTLRCDNYFIIEPYNPSHFSRQFGFCQDIPCVRRNNVRSLPLEEGFRTWRLTSRFDTGSQLYLSTVPADLHLFRTKRYQEWWDTKHDGYLKRGIETLVAAARPLPRKGDGGCANPVQANPVRITLKKRPIPTEIHVPSEGSRTASDEERHFKRKRPQDDVPPTPRITLPSNDFTCQQLQSADKRVDFTGDDNDHSVDSPFADELLELIQKGEPSAHKPIRSEGSASSRSPAELASVEPAVSTFCLDSVASRAYKRYATSIWEDIRDKISKTPLNHSYNITKEIKDALDLIEEREHLDMAPIRSLVMKYVQSSVQYSDLVKAKGETMTIAARDKEVALMRGRLADVQDKERTIMEKKTTLQRQIADDDARIEELRRQLSNCVEAKASREYSLRDATVKADEVAAEVGVLKESMHTLKRVKVVRDEDIQSIEELRVLIENTREEIAKFTWEP